MLQMLPLLHLFAVVRCSCMLQRSNCGPDLVPLALDHNASFAQRSVIHLFQLAQGVTRSMQLLQQQAHTVMGSSSRRTVMTDGMCVWVEGLRNGSDEKQASQQHRYAPVASCHINMPV